MAREPLEQALSQRTLLKEAIDAGVGVRLQTRYEPPGRTADTSRLSFLAASETDPILGEQFAPFQRRLVGMIVDFFAIALIWFMGFAGIAVLVVPFYTMLPENSPTYLAPVFQAFVISIPFWCLWMFNAQGWAPSGRFTYLRAVDEFGAAPGIRRGLIRTIAMLVSVLPLGLGFWAAAWHRERQTWHDRLAGTRVIHLLR